MNDKELSQERKKLQEKGLLPVWFTTGGWQVATTLAKHIGNNYPLCGTKFTVIKRGLRCFSM